MAALSSDHHCFSIESLELMEGYIGEMDLLYVVVHQHNLLLVKVCPQTHRSWYKYTKSWKACHRIYRCKWVTCPWLMHRVIHKWLLNSYYWDACVSSNTRYVVFLHSTAIRQNLRYAIVCYNSSCPSHHI